MPQNKGPFYMTTAIAYTSGKPHIGNTYEVVLADSIARFRRQEGYDVFFQTGTDEHGQKIELKAEETVAYQIAVQTVEELKQKTFLELPMPMTKDRELLEKSHEEAADRVEECLQKGQNVVFLTLGDPTVYSTYLYVHKRIAQRGYRTELTSGITSFCAVAAKLNIGLVEKAEELHVIPASYQIEDALKLPGTKVLMKAGRKIGQVKELLKKAGMQAMMIENCGMENEKIYQTVDEIPENAGYYSLIIVKEN